MSGASRKIQSSICQITRLGRRSSAAASTKLCSREFEPVIASFTERTPSSLPEVDRKRGTHEYRVEILAVDQTGVLHAAVRRIHRGKQARRPEKLQRIDNEIERGRHHNDEPARTQKPHQMVARGG